MGKGKYLLELAELIPIRNINFYIDACCGMSAVNLQQICDPDRAEFGIKKMKSLIAAPGLHADPRAAIEAIIDYFKDNAIDMQSGMKLLGKLIILYLRQGQFSEKASDNARLPYNFLSYAVVEDLKYHGEGPNFSFVEKCLDELAENQIIHPEYHALLVKPRYARYTELDMAAVFLGYSFASKGAMLPVTRFPIRPTGFVAVLIAELKKLIPRGEANRFIKSVP